MSTSSMPIDLMSVGSVGMRCRKESSLSCVMAPRATRLSPSRPPLVVRRSRALATSSSVTNLARTNRSPNLSRVAMAPSLKRFRYGWKERHQTLPNGNRLISCHLNRLRDILVQNWCSGRTEVIEASYRLGMIVLRILEFRARDGEGPGSHCRLNSIRFSQGLRCFVGLQSARSLHGNSARETKPIATEH